MSLALNEAPRGFAIWTPVSLMMPSGSTLFVLFYRYRNRGAFDEHHTQAPVRRPSAGREARVRQQLCSSVSLSMIIFFFSAEVNINRDRMRLDEENFRRCGEASGDQARRGIKRAVTLAGREAGARRDHGTWQTKWPLRKRPRDVAGRMVPRSHNGRHLPE